MKSKLALQILDFTYLCRRKVVPTFLHDALDLLKRLERELQILVLLRFAPSLMMQLQHKNLNSFAVLQNREKESIYLI